MLFHSVDNFRNWFFQFMELLYFVFVNNFVNKCKVLCLMWYLIERNPRKLVPGKSKCVFLFYYLESCLGGNGSRGQTAELSSTKIWFSTQSAWIFKVCTREVWALSWLVFVSKTKKSQGTFCCCINVYKVVMVFILILEYLAFSTGYPLSLSIQKL